MEIEDIYEKLKTLDIPVAYCRFKNVVPPPYIVYYVSDESIYGGDNINLLCRYHVKIELYNEIKDFLLERKIQRLFSDFELKKDELYISDENLIETVYKFSFVSKL